MNTLVLDSTNVDLTVGLIKNNQIDYINYPCWQQQSEKMIPEIDNILKRNNILPKEINEILVTVGPGSYTGVRIALTIAKVYGLALNIPIYLYSSLEALMNVNKTSICLINARSKRSYFAVYNKNECIIKDTIKTNEEVLEYIKNHPDYEVCGDVEYLGLKGYKSNLVETLNLLKNNDRIAKDVYSLKAVYLKD